MNTEYNPQSEYSSHLRPNAPGATGSMICGILGLLACPLISIFAIVMGHKAQGRIRRSNGALGGDGKATAGLITGYIGLAMGLLVVPIMAAILVPAVTKVTSDAKFTQMKSNGKNMFVAVYADAIDTNIVGFPGNSDYPTSTAYFKALAGDNPKGMKVLAATPDYVGGPHVQPATSWRSFAAQNNGWCAVEGLDETSDAGIPFLISSNIKARNLSELRGRVGDSIDPAAKGAMRRQVVVAYIGAGAQVLRADEDWDNFGWPDLNILHP